MTTTLLQTDKKSATMGSNTAASPQSQAHIVVSRIELEKEHSNLLERLHQLRRLLNYPPLMTGKAKRRE